MKCQNCKNDTLCLRFRKIINDGFRSYVVFIPICAECMKKWNFPIEGRELILT